MSTTVFQPFKSYGVVPF